MLNVVDFLLKFVCRASPLHAPALLLIGRITLSPPPQMDESEQEEQEVLEEEEEREEEKEEESDEFNVIPPYSEKEDSKIESGARGSKRGAAGQVLPTLPLLLLPVLILHREFWSY